MVVVHPCQWNTDSRALAHLADPIGLQAPPVTLPPSLSADRNHNTAQHASATHAEGLGNCLGCMQQVPTAKPVPAPPCLCYLQAPTPLAPPPRWALGPAFPSLPALRAVSVQVGQETTTHLFALATPAPIERLCM
jgi:hypothetical protein